MNALDFAEFSPFEMESLLLTIEDSLKVQKRSQFFLWAQGGLQSFIPHETLLCAWGDVMGNRFMMDVFSRSERASEAARELAEAESGMLSKMVEQWQRNGYVPCLLIRGSDMGLCPPQIIQLMRQTSGNAIAHGAKEMLGEYGSFFMFLGLDRHPGPRDAYLMEILMPYLHMAVHRMASYEELTFNVDALEEVGLSGREIQVLRWVRDGKTNQEIALILSISPLTVKNHVQNILRKLNVTNRAQAVAKGMDANLFFTEDAV